MFLVDLTHTSHTTAQTGIQRVCRSLFRALKEKQPAEAITYDPYEQGWRPLASWERRNLSSLETATKRGARWPLAAQLGGRARRVLRRRETPAPAGTGLIVPELFSPAVAANLPRLKAAVSGPRIALFHDAIALKFPELSPRKTVARFPGYLRELLTFDAIAAVSEDSRASLVDYWQWLGIDDAPAVRAVTLPLTHTPPRTAAKVTVGLAPLTILCVGTIEGRKNHLALLEACEQLWGKNREFTLRLIGLANSQTGRAALEKIQALQAQGRPLRYDGPVTDEVLEAAYSECEFTVYPSLIEGFGLPVLESLSHGKPCICSARGALGESARGGGCLALENVDAPSLAAAIDQLITSELKRAELSRAAHQRTFKTWSDYTDELVAWMKAVSRRETS